MTGTLWLVPNSLDLGADPVAIEDVLALGVLRRAAALSHWVVEDARSARAFLKRVQAVVPLAAPLQSLDIRELPRPPKGAAARSPSPPADPMRALLAPALGGADIGLLSEAGLPAVADPGARLVAAAHAAGVPVAPMAGPSSLLMALAASGLEGQRFAFVGYVPQEAAARATRLRELEQRSRLAGETQILIETPYRNAALLSALLETLAPGTRLSVACGLTLPGGWVRSMRVADWRGAGVALPDRLPAVFALLA